MDISETGNLSRASDAYPFNATTYMRPRSQHRNLQAAPATFAATLWIVLVASYAGRYLRFPGLGSAGFCGASSARLLFDTDERRARRRRGIARLRQNIGPNGSRRNG